MVELISLVMAIVYIITDIYLAFKVNEAAQMKGHGSVLLLCLLLGPAAYLYVIALPDLELRNAIKAMQANGNANNVSQSSGGADNTLSRAAEATVIRSVDGKWRCPACGESNPTSTRICRGCGREK